jgi:hypothetical protein
MPTRNEAYIPSLVSESRAAQGLPPKIEDPATLAKVAALLRRPLAAGIEVPQGTRGVCS